MQTRYVNTASTAGGDGTTNATSGANRAYATMAEWEAARQASLTEVEEVICEGSTADTSGVTIDGWTTTAANYILIRTTQANRHNGRWDTTKYRVDVNRNYLAAIEVYEYYVRIQGVQFRNTGTGNWGQGGVLFMPDETGDVAVDTTFFEMRDCVVYGSGNGNGIVFYGGNATAINCISYGNSGSGFVYGLIFWTGTRYVDHRLYNCLSAANGAIGFNKDNPYDAAACVVRNCYAGGNTGDDYGGNALNAYDAHSNNRSEDGSKSTTTAAYSTSSGAYFTNITAGSENFDIGSSSSFIDAGYDLSGTFTTDILGNARGATFDIGPFEYQAAAVASLPPKSISSLTAVRRAAFH